MTHLSSRPDESVQVVVQDSEKGYLTFSNISISNWDHRVKHLNSTGMDGESRYAEVFDGLFVEIDLSRSSRDLRAYLGMRGKNTSNANEHETISLSGSSLQMDGTFIRQHWGKGTLLPSSNQNIAKIFFGQPARIEHP